MTVAGEHQHSAQSALLVASTSLSANDVLHIISAATPRLLPQTIAGELDPRRVSPDLSLPA